jgi:hypothetical protein
MSNNKKNPKSRILSIEETNARLEKEFAQQDAQVEDLSPKEGESKAFDGSMQSSSVEAEKAEEIVPVVSAFGSDRRPLRDSPGMLFPDNTLITVTRQIRTRRIFSRKLPATLKKEKKTHPYSWTTSGS